MGQPLFSVITVNRNNREGLLRTVKSVSSQRWRDLEFIVIDGASTDGSADVLREHDRHISYWTSEPDRGIYQAMNKGIRKAAGRYLNFMNSGDRFYDDRVLERVASYIMAGDAPEADIITGRDYHYDEGRGLGHASIQPVRLSMVTFFNATLDHQSSFIRRELFADSLYREDLRLVSDWAFFLDKVVIEGRRVQFIPDIVCFREAGGITWQQYDKNLRERDACLHRLLPPGVYQDYATLSHLDKDSLYKLFVLCEQPRAVRWLTYCIKALYRLLKRTNYEESHYHHPRL